MQPNAHVAPRSARWERQIIAWLARHHARAEGRDRPSLHHFRLARATLRQQERLNAQAVAECELSETAS